MTGLNTEAALLQAVREKLKTIRLAQSFQLRVDHVGEGQAVLTMPYRREYDGIFDSFHGGLLMTLADTAACVAVLTKTGPDAVVTTTDMNIRFLAPCLTDATADARIIKFGKTLNPVAVTLRDANGKDVAVAQVTYMRLDRMPGR